MLFESFAVLLVLRAAAGFTTEDGYVEVKSPNDTEDLLPLHAEPQVAMTCDDGSRKLINKFMDENGEWQDDTVYQESCLTNKADILDYCKRLYPTKDITNIVESIRTYRIKSWCRKGKVGKAKCRGTYWIKPYRCLQGTFQSEALLVPRKCQFDHLHNSSHCWNFNQWNESAIEACNKHKMNLLSFSVLIPCGVDMWEGVEFVCCPKEGQKSPFPEQKAALKKPLSVQQESDEDEDEDDEDLDDEEDDEEEINSDNDPYLKLNDPKKEHSTFLSAKERLQRTREKKINRIMEAWSKMEEKVEELSKTNPESANEYRKEMTTALRKEVAAVEEEHEAKKRQLLDLHQQRVLRNLSQKKPEAQKCYMEALHADVVNNRKLEKCLQKLLRALHKERHHYLSHYRHLLMTRPEEAASIRQLTLGQLVENDMTVNKSLNMLNQKPNLRQKLLPLMQQYADALRTKDASPIERINVLSRSRETEEAILKAYEREADAKKVRDARIQAIHDEETKKEQENEVEKIRVIPEPVPFSNHLDEEEEGMAVEDENDPIVLPPPKRATEGEEPIHTVSQVIDEEPLVAHAMAHELTHDAPSFTAFKTEDGGNNQSAILAVAFAGIALTLVIGVSVMAIKRRSRRERSKNGFTAVDQASTPEERHVAKMQINGYENPTYRFFEEEE